MIDADTWAMVDGGPVVLTELPAGEVTEDPEIVDAVIVDGPQDLILAEIGTAGEAGARPIDLAETLGLSRATIYRYLMILQETGQIATKGRGRFVRS
jgi:hypothetical protein